MIAQIIKTQKPSGPISIDSVSKDINELKAYAEKKDSEKKASQFAQKPIIINTL